MQSGPSCRLSYTALGQVAERRCLLEFASRTCPAQYMYSYSVYAQHATRRERDSQTAEAARQEVCIDHRSRYQGVRERQLLERAVVLQRWREVWLIVRFERHRERV